MPENFGYYNVCLSRPGLFLENPSEFLFRLFHIVRIGNIEKIHPIFIGRCKDFFGNVWIFLTEEFQGTCQQNFGIASSEDFHQGIFDQILNFNFDEDEDGIHSEEAFVTLSKVLK